MIAIAHTELLEEALNDNKQIEQVSVEDVEHLRYFLFSR
jgi:hypothetical protein